MTLVIDFKSKQCRMNQHSFCHGSWTGLRFRCNCECTCHQEKNQAIDKVLEQASITIGPSLSEGSNEGLVIKNKSAVGTNHSNTDEPVPQPVTSSGDQKSRVFSREN